MLRLISRSIVLLLRGTWRIGYGKRARQRAEILRRLRCGAAFSESDHGEVSGNPHLPSDRYRIKTYDGDATPRVDLLASARGISRRDVCGRDKLPMPRLCQSLLTESRGFGVKIAWVAFQNKSEIQPR
jgi:hypothetical protein